MIQYTISFLESTVDFVSATGHITSRGTSDFLVIPWTLFLDVGSDSMDTIVEGNKKFSNEAKPIVKLENQKARMPRIFGYSLNEGVYYEQQVSM